MCSKCIALILASLLVVAAIVIPRTKAVNLHRDPCVVISYTVHMGDTLWSIVEPYIPEGISRPEYIAEVKRLNGGSSLGFIHPGEKISIPVYERRQ